MQKKDSLISPQTPEIEAGAVATGAAMGRYITHLTDARFLARAVPLRGAPGMFDASLPRMLLEGDFDPSG